MMSSLLWKGTTVDFPSFGVRRQQKKLHHTSVSKGFANVSITKQIFFGQDCLRKGLPEKLGSFLEGEGEGEDGSQWPQERTSVGEKVNSGPSFLWCSTVVPEGRLNRVVQKCPQGAPRGGGKGGEMEGGWGGRRKIFHWFVPGGLDLYFVKALSLRQSVEPLRPNKVARIE